MIVGIIGGIIGGIILGIATAEVIENKGYDENWFWWGFFFGFIALIIALTKPEKTSYYYDSSYVNKLSGATTKNSSQCLIQNGGWKCNCGRINASYIGTCACGKTKENIKESETSYENEKLENIKKLKELYDLGAITEDEFNEKKKSYLK